MPRQTIRLLSRIVLLTVPVLLAFLFVPLDHASAQFESALRGEYNVSMERGCANENPVLGGADTANQPRFTLKGQSSFDGTATMTFTGQVLSPDSTGIDGAHLLTGTGTEFSLVQADVTGCTGPYSVAADGSFTGTFSTCTLNFNVGPLVGQPVTLSGMKMSGKLAMDGTILVIGTTSATLSDVETLSCATCDLDGPGPGTVGSPQRRVCSSSGVGTSRR